ncbi:Putative STE/STE11 protein kinase [Rhizopus microsporus]|nr:Putative STE/STE11 protein kinase [Rhizopus microsporus]CEI92017.1 Putative STE/STE11 protein kinase [Rhizopus microsporus]
MDSVTKHLNRSLGCTVLEMLTGTHPWMHLTSLAALYAIGNHKSPEIPSNISSEAKDFLEQCFRINPEDRPTAKQLLEHPFVQPNDSFNFKDALIKLKSNKQ